MTNANEANALLMGSGVPSASFRELGKSVSGTICAEPEKQQQQDMDGNPKTFDNGDPMWQVVITLQTDECDPDIEDDDGRRKLYVKSNMMRAVREAVKQSGQPGVSLGGKLTVTYTHDGEAKKRGYNPPKFYSAEYVPPASNTLNDDDDETPPRSTDATVTDTKAATDREGKAVYAIVTSVGQFITYDDDVYKAGVDAFQTGSKATIQYRERGGRKWAVGVTLHHQAAQPAQPTGDDDDIPF